MPVLYAYSPTLLPPPADWPSRFHVTGAWFLDPPPGWQPPADLVSFLEGGPPPVYVGFGSMTSADPDATLALVLDALSRAAQRGVLLHGWAGLGAGRELPDTVIALDDVPHSWLFPRMAALVHHGGAGTTAAGLRAGIPSVVTPLTADQPSWGRIVHRLGAGPRPIPFRHLTATRLSRAIESAVSEPAIHERAAELGERIRAEDGVGQAVELVTESIEAHRQV
jgi:UDP:flavonoid glycosyltransferase YjiC (YdhE family)